MRADDDLPLFLEELVTLLNKYHFSMGFQLHEISGNDYEVGDFYSFVDSRDIFIPAFRKKESENEKYDSN